MEITPVKKRKIIRKPNQIRGNDLVEPTMCRFQIGLAKQIDDWAKTQERLITRPEAIRRLVAVALAKENAE